MSTSATGSGAISVLMDRSVSGSITTSGIAGTAAHIHLAPAGQNGPVIVSLTRTADNMWSVPPGVRLTDTQYDAFKQGNLYVNVHSAALPSGQVRGQMGQRVASCPFETALDERHHLDRNLGAVEALDVEGRDVHGMRASVGDQLGHELAGDGPVHEAVAAEAGQHVETRNLGHLADDAHLIGR